jgi:hypothetical protein
MQTTSNALEFEEHASLCEALDRVLNKGAVIVGDVTISVADIDLIYLGLQVVLTSIETGRTLALVDRAVGAEAERGLR